MQSTPTLHGGPRNAAFITDFQVLCRAHGKENRDPTFAHDYVPGLNDCHIQMAIADSGAGPSIVSQSVLNQLPKGVAVRTVKGFEPCSIPVEDANGGALHFTGQVEIHFLLDGMAYNHIFTVNEGGDLLLLGNDFLCAHQATIHLGECCCLTLPHSTLSGGKRHRVRLDTTLKTPSLETESESSEPESGSKQIAAIALPKLDENETSSPITPQRYVTPDLSRLIRKEHLLFSEAAIPVAARTSRIFWLKMPKRVTHDGPVMVSRLPPSSGLTLNVLVQSLICIPNSDGKVCVSVTNPHYHSTVIPACVPVALLETDEFPEPGVLPFVDPTASAGTSAFWERLSETEREVLSKISIDPDHLLTTQQKKRVQELVAEFKHVFAVNPKRPGTTHAMEAKFDLKPGMKPHKHAPSKLGDISREIVEKEIAELEANGLIRKSNSPWASRIVLVKKKDGSARMCCDYRQLNEKLLVADVPLPRCDEAMERLGGSVIGGTTDADGLKVGGKWLPSRWFATMDLASGFWAVPIRESDKGLTAFCHHRGKHEWNVLPFGVSSGPETMVRLMEAALTGLAWDVCMTFLDDLASAGAGEDDDQAFECLMDRLRQIFQRLQWAGLTAKASKCVFFATEVEFLGHIVGRKGIATDPAKVQALLDIPARMINTLKNVRSFLGLAGYYRKFIPEFANIAAPLTNLTRANVCVTTESQKPESLQAIETIKRLLTEAPVLAIPRGDRRFILKTDACSTWGLGGVLTQPQDEGEDRPIGYYARRLKSAELNYTVTEQELLAVVACARHFRSYLWGRKWTLITDHSALRWLHTMRDTVDGGMSSRLTRWSLLLQEYNFEVQHKPGKLHHDADALSRLAAATYQAIDEHPRVIAARQRITQEGHRQIIRACMASFCERPEPSHTPPITSAVAGVTQQLGTTFILPFTTSRVGGCKALPGQFGSDTNLHLWVAPGGKELLGAEPRPGEPPEATLSRVAAEICLSAPPSYREELPEEK